MQPILEEIKILLLSVRAPLVVSALLTIFFFTCGLTLVTINGLPVYIPVVTDASFSALALSHMVQAIVPEGVPLMVTEPLAAFVAQVKISFLLACVVMVPLLLFNLITYLQPALYKHERTLLYAILVPTSLLFAAGNWFAYAYILPTTFTVLYGFAEPLGAVSFISVGDFVSLSIALMVLCGVSFTLPVVMFLLSLFGAISPSLWVTHWRYAAVIFLILSAIITPDGSGVTMLLFSIPLSVLYIAGAVASIHFAGKKRRTEMSLK